MARVHITVNEVWERNQLSSAFENLCVAVDAQDGAEFNMEGADGKYLILIQNSATAPKTVTLVKGNGLQGTCDHTEALAGSSYAFMSIDSGRFKNVSGADKGKVIIKGEDANVKVAVFRLP